MADKKELTDMDDYIANELGSPAIDISLDNEPNQPLPGSVDEFDQMLNDFINSQLDTVEMQKTDISEDIKNNKPAAESLSEEADVTNDLYEEEKSLYDAYCNFKDAVKILTEQSGIKTPEFNVKAKNLYTRYSPLRGRAFADDIIEGWQAMIDAQPVRLRSLKPTATDEDILEFAERTADETLQMALISYVEILIELESCEIAYNMRKVKAKKRRIVKEIYEEHQKRKEKIQKYIKEIEKKKLPVDAERLVTNYFKTAKKDPDGAFKVLVTNPATYAPILINKIPSRFFGMIKPKPQDGVKWNRIIGDFLRKLKA